MDLVIICTQTCGVAHSTIHIACAFLPDNPLHSSHFVLFYFGGCYVQNKKETVCRERYFSSLVSKVTQELVTPFFPPLMFYMNWETLPIMYLIPQRSVLKATNSTFSDSRSTSEGHVQFLMCIQPCSRTGGGSPCCSPKARQQRDVRKQNICLATVLTPIIISKSSQQYPTDSQTF